ncbi:MAG: hypothetical protein R2695_22070 [Acidimicrobiales bacterium]
MAGFTAPAGPGNNWARPRSPVMMLGLRSAAGGTIFEPGATVTVAIVAGLVMLVARRTRWLLAPVAAGLIAVGVASGLPALDRLYDANVALKKVAGGSTGSGIDRLVVDPRSPRSLPARWCGRSVSITSPRRRSASA